MNIIKKLIAWVRVDPQQDELDARREHFELLGIQGSKAVAVMESIGARWLPFGECSYGWRIGGADWATSTDPCLMPFQAMTTWPADHQQSAAIYTLGLMGYRWSPAFQDYQKVKDQSSERVAGTHGDYWHQGYVDAFYKVAEWLQVDQAQFKPQGLTMAEVVEAHILSLLAVEAEYFKLIDKNSRRKQNLNELYGKLSPNVKISSQGVAVDQDYFWNYDMDKCPQGKVQLLGNGGIPAYGYKAQGGAFWQAWAPLPKTRK